MFRSERKADNPPEQELRPTKVPAVEPNTPNTPRPANTSTTSSPASYPATAASQPLLTPNLSYSHQSRTPQYPATRAYPANWMPPQWQAYGHFSYPNTPGTPSPGVSSSSGASNPYLGWLRKPTSDTETAGNGKEGEAGKKS